MTGLSDDDVERIAVSLAPKLVQCVRQERHDFWIDPEKHYQSHMNSDRLATAFDDKTIASLKEMGALHAGAKRNVVKLVFVLLTVIALLGAIVYGIFAHAPVKPLP